MTHWRGSVYSCIWRRRSPTSVTPPSTETDHLELGKEKQKAAPPHWPLRRWRSSNSGSNEWRDGRQNGHQVRRDSAARALPEERQRRSKASSLWYLNIDAKTAGNKCHIRRLNGKRKSNYCDRIKWELHSALKSHFPAMFQCFSVWRRRQPAKYKHCLQKCGLCNFLEAKVKCVRHLSPQFSHSLIRTGLFRLTARFKVFTDEMGWNPPVSPGVYSNSQTAALTVAEVTQV